MLLLCLVGSTGVAQEWYTRVNSDDINAVAGTSDALWAVTNAGGTLFWDLSAGELDKFLTTQPCLYSDEEDTSATVRVWLEDELLTNSFTSVAIGPSETVWLGCNLGINVVDVSAGDPWNFTFDTKTVSNSPLPSNLITTMVWRAGTSEMWIGTQDAGIAVYDHDTDTWVYHTTDDGLASNRVNCIYFDDYDCVWVGSDAGVTKVNMNFDPWPYSIFDTSNSGLPSDFVTGVVGVPCCWVWFTTDGGAARVDLDDNWLTYGTWTSSHIVSNDMLGILYHPGSSHIWIWTSLGISFYSMTTEHWDCFTADNTSGGLLSSDVRDVFHDGNYFIIGTQRGICRYDGAWSSSFENHLASNYVKAVACQEGQVWFGTYGEGANLLADWNANEGQPGMWETFSYAPSDAITSNYVNDVALDNRLAENAVWFATNLGVSYFDYMLSNWTTFDTSNTAGGLPSDRVMAIALDPRGYDGGEVRTWFGTDNGLACYTGGSTTHWDTFNIMNSGLPSNYITCLASEVRDSAYYLWVGTNWGVVVLDVVNGSWRRYDTSNSSILSENVRCISVEGDSSIWIGTTNGVSILDRPNTWTSIRTSDPLSGLGSNTINSVVFGSNNNAWIATSRGLTKFDTASMMGTRYTVTNSGLINDNVYDLCYQPCVGLWAATRGGASVLRHSLPVVTDATVVPPVGGPYTDFVFSVHFTDDDGTAPSSGTLVVAGGSHSLELVSGTPDDGVYSASAALPSGHWYYYFLFVDSDGCQVRYPAGSDVIEGPDVYDIFEPDNHCMNAHLLWADGSSFGETHNLVPLGEDEDWFYFRAERHTEYAVASSIHGNSDVMLELYRNDCSQLVAVGASITFWADEAGYYFIRVVDNGSTLGSAGSYSIWIFGEEWPMLAHCPTRAATVAAIGPRSYLEEFTYSTSPTIASTPAVDLHGCLYFGASYGRLVSLDSQFNVRWVCETGDTEPVLCSPAIGTHPTWVVYFGTQEGYFYSVYRGAGTILWRYPSGAPLPEPILSSPAVDSDGNVYFACYDGTVYSLTPSGSLRWSRSVICNISHSSPALSTGADPRLYIGSTEGQLYAIGLSDGIVDLTYDVGYPIRSTPSIDDDGNVYFGADDGILYCLNPAGDLRWSFETNGAIEGHGAFGGHGRYYFGSTDGRFYALDCTATEAQAAWSYDTGHPITNGPAVDGSGRIFFGSEGGRLYCSDEDGPHLGTFLWNHNLAEPITSSMVIGQDHQLFFVSDEYTVHALHTANTNPVLTFPEVDPPMGMAGDEFEYSVYFSDIDHDFPSKQFIVIDGQPYRLDYRASIDRYYYNAVLNEAGPHTYYFYFEDGYGGFARVPETGVYYGPIVDNEPPRSQCSSPIGTNEPEIPVDFVAADDGSGVASTRLYYAYSLDGQLWPPVQNATDTGLTMVGETGTFTFVPSDGDGYYAFFTVATDRAGFIEAAPVFFYDTITVYDTTPPVTQDVGTPPSLRLTPFTIDSFNVRDAFQGPLTITIYYRFMGGAWADSGIEDYTHDPVTGDLVFLFDATYGQGQYDFYIIASDEMNNAQTADYAQDPDRILTVYYDAVTPESSASCEPFSRTSPLYVYWTASDDLTGIARLEVYCRRLGDLDWAVVYTYAYNDPSADKPLDELWTAVGWEYKHPKQGSIPEGIYTFYTCATDGAGNREPAPQRASDPDCVVTYDTTRPLSCAAAAGVYSAPGNVTVAYAASDNLAGLKEVRLFYNHNGGAFVRSSQAKSAEASTFSFSPTDGDGVYCFYTVATDKCGNVEAPPMTFDAFIERDTTAPSSACYCAGESFMVPMEVYFEATDEMSDIEEVGLWVKYEDGEWEDTGMALEGDSGTFEFMPMAVQGHYLFQTIAVDALGHVEAFKPDDDPSNCETDLQFSLPSSRGSCDRYTNETPIVISFTASQAATNVRLAYRYTYYGEMTDVTEATVGAGHFDFEPEEGEGDYYFWLFARDLAGNAEGIKSYDCRTTYDVTAPESSCSCTNATWRHNVNVAFTAEDNLSGIDTVDLWVSYTDPDDSTRNVAWAPADMTVQSSSGSFNFVFNHGLGIYRFYTIAADRSGNVEPTSLDPDAIVQYEIGPPTSRCWVFTRPISVHMTNDKDNPIEIIFDASDPNGNTSGLREVRLYYAYQMAPKDPIDDWTSDDIQWRYTGQAVAPDVGYFHFYPKDGNGTYGFYTLAVDQAGNVQPKPLLMFDVPNDVPYWDAYITYDIIAPVSECSAYHPFVEDGAIGLTYQADDDPFYSDSWPEEDYDTTGVDSVRLWYQFNGGSWQQCFGQGSEGYYEQGGLWLDPPNGFGTYGFCTRAMDVAGNLEALPAVADCTVIYGPFDPEIELSATSHDFGVLSIGAIGEWNLRIYNQGTEDLFIVQNGIYTDNAETFSVDPNYVNQIAPGDWSDVTVMFHPWAIGPTSCTLFVESNDFDERTCAVDLSGTAVGPLGPTLIVQTPTRLVRPGEEFSATIGLAGISEDLYADVYIAAMLPTGELLFYPNWTSAPTGTPVWLPAGFSLRPTEFLKVTYDGALPKGEYRLYAALVKPGTQFEFLSEIAETRWVFY